MTVVNKIVTRGFGAKRVGFPGRAGPVTQGYGNLPVFIPALFERASIKAGRSGKVDLRELDVVVVWAKLVQFNDTPFTGSVQGSTRTSVDVSHSPAVFVRNVGKRVKEVADFVKVTAQRVKKN